MNGIMTVELQSRKTIDVMVRAAKNNRRVCKMCKHAIDVKHTKLICLAKCRPGHFELVTKTSRCEEFESKYTDREEHT